MNSLRIRDRTYLLQEVLLYVEYRGRSADGLTFSLFADTGDLQQAGFAIHCMSVPGAARIDDLRFALEADCTNTLNELGESVICEPGVVLELSSLRLAFGPVRGGVVPVTLDAVCSTREETGIPVRGAFVGRIEQDEPPEEHRAQQVFPF